MIFIVHCDYTSNVYLKAPFKFKIRYFFKYRKNIKLIKQHINLFSLYVQGCNTLTTTQASLNFFEKLMHVRDFFVKLRLVWTAYINLRLVFRTLNILFHSKYCVIFVNLIKF